MESDLLNYLGKSLSSVAYEPSLVIMKEMNEVRQMHEEFVSLAEKLLEIYRSRTSRSYS